MGRMNKTCERCGAPFDVKPAYVAKGRGRFCSASCYNESRKGVALKQGIRHRMMRAPGHPIAPPSGIAPVARVRLYDAIGPGPHRCHWCSKEVHWIPGVGVRRQDVLVVDHLDHDATNDELTNLAPSCNACNAHRRQSGDSPIIQPGELYLIAANGNRTRAVVRQCESCGQDFTTRLSEVRLGKGRFCSMSCARRGQRAS